MNTQEPYEQFGQSGQFGQYGYQSDQPGQSGHSGRPPQPEPSEQGSIHETVGAYALGILDDAEATAFEAHLAGCDICAAHLEEFAGMAPMLAMLAEAPSAVPRQRQSSASQPPVTDLPFSSTLMEPPRRPAAPVVPTAPSPQMLDKLVGEVAVKRARKRQRSMFMIAASAVLILGGPAIAVVVTDDDAEAGVVAAPNPSSPAEDAFFNQVEEKVQNTDAATKVSATIGLEQKPYGTRTVMELKNVEGPEKCQLVVVSKAGKEEVVGSWNVPEWGYGIADATDEKAQKPLYVNGVTAMERNEIDHFEIRTFDGKRLVEVDG
ncbi:zf-HC2 domain-containing protein [Streptomyces sp. NPDC019396]|uniref:anti-sigma factor family protein n=1 Tax=Streptomyces sp. NPDC019396 TaxID=3154687 RepID=UPI0033F824B0